MTLPIQLDDASTFTAVYEEHHRDVAAVVRRIVKDGHLAEEVTQDVFLTVWRRPSLFDSERSDLRTFLRVLARSRAVDAWRSMRVRGAAQLRLTAEALHTAQTAEDPLTHVERRIRGSEVRAAMKVLSESQREALALAYWADLPASAISARTGAPIGTAKSRVRLALNRVRQELDAQDRSAIDPRVAPQLP